MMRQHSSKKRLVAALAGFALIAAACGDDSDDDEDATTDTTEAPAGDGDAEAEPVEDRLLLGHVTPETGPLAFLGPPMIAGVDLAVSDINEAGGVLGADVEMNRGDEGETDDAALESATRLMGDGANVIIGAAASGRSQAFIQQTFEAGIPQCSGSNTAPDFTDQHDGNAALYYRTVPPDEAVSSVIADEVLADGHLDVAVVARGDDYGQGLSDLVVEGLEAGGADVVTNPIYDPEAASFESEIEDIAGSDPEAVVFISFDEVGDLLAGVIERGLDPATFYGGDGTFSPTLFELVDETDANVIDGMKVIGAAGDEEFNARIADETENNLIYGGQYYDCVVVTALAAEAAGSVAGQDIVDNVATVTNDGTECNTFADCKDLLDQGEDIQYIGAAGAVALDDAGDPTGATYAIGQFEDAEFTIVDSVDVEL